MSKIAILLGLTFFSLHLHAYQIALGLHKPDPKVQDSRGSEKADPISPYIQLGWQFVNEFTWIGNFVPRVGFVQNRDNSDDHYTKYKIETYTVLYDFYYKPQTFVSTNFRYGLGSFIQRITGPGGQVEVPNGNSTMSVYQPDGTKTSALLSLNLGVDYRVGKPLWNEYIPDYGASFQVFYMDPGGKHSYLTYQLGFVSYIY